MNEDIERRLEEMKGDIEALQGAKKDVPKPWYKTIPTVISMTALLFSFGTTYVSNRRIAAQDIQSRRQELRSLLQRLSVLPKEMAEVGKKYQDDAGSAAFVSGYINQENALLARNAAEIAKKLPQDAVSATDFYAIAVALQNSYDLMGAQEFLGYSIATSPDFNTEIAALRVRANLKYLLGDADAGRLEFQRALEIFSKHPQYDPYTRTSTNVQTEVSWAISEANINSFAVALQHLGNAEKLVAALPNSPGAQNLLAQVNQAKFRISGGSKPVVPGSGLSPGVPNAPGTRK